MKDFDGINHELPCHDILCFKPYKIVGLDLTGIRGVIVQRKTDWVQMD